MIPKVQFNPIMIVLWIIVVSLGIFVINKFSMPLQEISSIIMLYDSIRIPCIFLVAIGLFTITLVTFFYNGDDKK